MGQLIVLISNLIVLLCMIYVYISMRKVLKRTEEFHKKIKRRQYEQLYTERIQSKEPNTSNIPKYKDGDPPADF